MIIQYFTFKEYNESSEDDSEDENIMPETRVIRGRTYVSNVLLSTKKASKALPKNKDGPLDVKTKQKLT